MRCEEISYSISLSILFEFIITVDLIDEIIYNTEINKL